MTICVQLQKEITLRNDAPAGYAVSTDEVAIFHRGPATVEQVSECSVLYGFSEGDRFFVAHVSALSDENSLTHALMVANERSHSNQFYAFNLDADRHSSQLLTKVCAELGLPFKVQDVRINVADTLHLGTPQGSQRYSVERGSFTLQRYLESGYD